MKRKDFQGISIAETPSHTEETSSKLCNNQEVNTVTAEVSSGVDMKMQKIRRLHRPRSRKHLYTHDSKC
jgi:hypothetical protein